MAMSAACLYSLITALTFVLKKPVSGARSVLFLLIWDAVMLALVASATGTTGVVGYCPTSMAPSAIIIWRDEIWSWVRSPRTLSLSLGRNQRHSDKEPKPHDKMHRMELSLPEDVFLKIAPHLQASHVCALGKPFLEGIMLLRLTLGEVRSQEMAFLVDFDQGILSSG
ncbi:hypothetical protein MLD38_023554 [Melastoma candidum]|uniref:Uncharacterized protein n=1 Tax=Melastoma candidum TaxID=119954 RepID=A0ACB9NQN3_9MYRT|nr:hypothetical protein MLD38_023554 [Melastoma candidum]